MSNYRFGREEHLLNQQQVNCINCAKAKTLKKPFGKWQCSEQELSHRRPVQIVKLLVKPAYYQNKAGSCMYFESMGELEEAIQ